MLIFNCNLLLIRFLFHRFRFEKKNLKQFYYEKFILIFVCILFFTSCSNNEEIKTKSESIIGTWDFNARFLGNFDSNGDAILFGENQQPIHEITFLENFKFESTEANACDNIINIGTYSITKENDKNILEITIECALNPTGNFVRTFFMTHTENDELVLAYKSYPCSEPCADKYVRK
jgi:hypothetical protein